MIKDNIIICINRISVVLFMHKIKKHVVFNPLSKFFAYKQNKSKKMKFFIFIRSYLCDYQIHIDTICTLLQKVVCL